MAEKMKRPKIVGDYYVNQYGVKIPVKDVEQFRRNVAAINKRAARQVEKYSKFERMIDNQPTGQKVGDLMRMGYEPELAYSHRTANLNQFQSVEAFRSRLKASEKALKNDYISSRVADYKRNYTKALEQVYGPDAKPLVNKVRSMKQADFIKMITSNPDQLSIKNVYSKTGNSAENLYQLAESWGAKKASAEYEQMLDV